MRRAATLAMLTLIALAIGVGGTLTYQSVTTLREADGTGITVSCDVGPIRCWQAGEEVETPVEGGACAANALWDQATVGEAPKGVIYTCGGP